MARKYPFEDINEDDFAELVNRVCTQMLGIGVFSFAPGKDGGRDGKFTGTASAFPSSKEPHSGKFIIQAKWTSNPAASYSDSDFQTILTGKKGEKPKVQKLYSDGEIDHYMVFTNRRKPANKSTAKEKEFLEIGLKSVSFFGAEDLNRYIDLSQPNLWDSMGFGSLIGAWRITPDDIVEVVTAFHEVTSDDGATFNSSENFHHSGISKKNLANSLSEEYNTYIQENSLPYFDSIEKFLSNPRNTEYRDLYHDAADEFKQKLIANRNDFLSFDEALTYLTESIIAQKPELRGRKRYVRVFVHYMYYDCDIGTHA